MSKQEVLKAFLLLLHILDLLEEEARRDGRMASAVMADVFKRVRKRLEQEAR